MKVSYLVLTRNRPAELKRCLDSLLAQEWSDKEFVVVDNGSGDDTPEVMAAFLPDSRVKYYRLRWNLGVAGGRNFAIKQAGGDVLLTIDDDATLDDPAATRRIMEKFKDESIGVLALRIKNFVWRDGNLVSSPVLDRHMLPMRNKHEQSGEEAETSWFIGAGHAIRREVYSQAGLYRDFFPYGSEELDLAFRILDTPYRIVYFPSVVVRHTPSQRGRLTETRVWASFLKNRTKAAALNLPLYACGTHFLLRAAQVLWRGRGDPRPVLLALYWLALDVHKILRERRPISTRALSRLRRLGGPLLF